MKTALYFGSVVAAVSALFACGQAADGSCFPACAGTGGTSTAGTTGGGSGGQGGSNGGSGGLTNGQGGGEEWDPIVPAALIISGTGLDNTVTSEAIGVNGAGFIAQSPVMATRAVFYTEESPEGGKLCMRGVTAAVVNDDYASAWGAELIIDLARPQEPAGAGDAGADAGDAEVADIITPTGSWPYGNVLGWSYRIEGKDAALPVSGIPDLGLRFKGLPQDADIGDTFCSTRCPGFQCSTDGVNLVFFSDITYECWALGSPSLADDMIPRNSPDNLVPNPRALQNISWNVNADPGLTKPFDFCVYDIRPILSY